MSFKGLEETDAFGSCRVAYAQILLDFFRWWKWLLEQTLTTDLALAVSHWNFLASGAFFLTAIQTGLRTNGLAAPGSLYLRVWPAVEIQKQKKRPVAAYYPQRLRAYLQLLERRGRELKNTLRLHGAGITTGAIESRVFFHVVLTIHPFWATCLAADAESSLSAIGQHAEFQRFVELGTGWPRHWTNTVLREARLDENLVQRFHGHSPESFHALRWDQCAAIDFTLHEYISEYLSSLLGL